MRGLLTSKNFQKNILNYIGCKKRMRWTIMQGYIVFGRYYVRIRESCLTKFLEFLHGEQMSCELFFNLQTNSFLTQTELILNRVCLICCIARL